MAPKPAEVKRKPLLGYLCQLSVVSGFVLLFAIFTFQNADLAKLDGYEPYHCYVKTDDTMCTRLEFPYTHILDENNELVDIESLGPDAGEDMSYNFDKLFLWGFIIQCLPVCGALVMILGLALKWNWLLLIGSVIYMPVAPGILGWVFTGFCMRWNNAGHVASGDDYWPLVHAKDAALTATEETLKLRDYDTPEEMYEEEAVRAEALTVAELALEGYPSDYDHYLMTASGTFLNAYLTFMIFFMIANLIALILGIFLCKNTCWSTLKRMSPYQKPMLLPAQEQVKLLNDDEQKAAGNKVTAGENA